MSTELEKLREDLLALPKASRASLAHALIVSLDDHVDEDVEALWAAEIKKRDSDLKSGRTTSKPAEQVMFEARERLRCLK
jgi:putative addiction module component (TIGR02574 family)